MPNIKLEYTEIERVTKDLNTAVTDICPILGKLDAEVKGLMDNGLFLQHSQQPMKDAFESFTKSLTSAVKNIESFSQQFTNIRNQIETLDKTIAESLLNNKQ